MLESNVHPRADRRRLRGRSPHAAAARSARAGYEPRCPGDTLLYRLVDDHLDELVELAADRYAKPLPRYVVQTFRAFLKCGRLEHGFVRCRCDGCGHELLVPFSCSRRGLCPSCATRRMANTAAHLVDRILPNVPIRQWVLSLPFELRLLAARHPEVLAATGRIFVQEVFRRLRAATGSSHAECGAVSFIHRAGGSLNLNPHHHAAVLDGVFVQSPSAPSAGLDFVPAPPPRPGEILAVAERTRRRTVRWLRRHGYLDERSPAELADQLEEQSAIDGLLCFATSGAGHERLDLTGEPDPAMETSFEPQRRSPLSADCDGFNVDASVGLGPDDDEARERLMRYGGRPAFASDRLTELDDGRIAYRIRYARRGATHRVMTPVELLARLAALIPPPRHPLTRYFGILSSHAKHRARVVPRLPSPQPLAATDSSTAAASPNGPRPPSSTAPPRAPHRSAPSSARPRPTGPLSQVLLPPGAAAPPASESAARHASKASVPAPYTIISSRHLDRLLGGELLARSTRLDWATLLRRTLALDPLRCPHCNARLRPIAEITDPAVIERILDHLAALPPRAPPNRPAAASGAPARPLH